MKKYKTLRNTCVAMVTAVLAGIYFKMSSWDLGLIADQNAYITLTAYMVVGVFFGVLGYYFELKYQEKVYAHRKSRSHKHQLKTQKNRTALMKQIEKPIFDKDKGKHIA